jgi:hypothetical protein
MSTITNRIAAFAGRVVLGTQARQPEPPPPPEPGPPPPDAVGEARNVAQAFAGRLRELKAARDAMDSAVAAERAAASFDLAGAVARGEALPDPGEIAANRSRAELRLKALWQLANRECEGAGHAVHTVKVAALAEAKEARQEAIRWVVESLPPVFDKPEEIAKAARIVKESERAIFDLDKAPTLPLQKAPLFGMQLASFRLDALPAQPGILPRDGLDPEQVARDIERTIALHGEAVRFRCLVLTDPAGARWQG